MASSTPEPQPEGKADAASTSGEVQPCSYDEPAPRRSGLPLACIPDHDLLRCIGRGAYGAVWLARNVMGTCRAVKIVHREDFSRDRPFLREYEGLLKFEPVSRSHPNLMQILHVGRRDGYFYYVTELADDARQPEVGRQSSEVRSLGADVEGPKPPSISTSSSAYYVPRTLQEDLEHRRRLPVRECVTLATALASALKHLHEYNLVHRDVKPSNVIFVHGVPKLADIGLVATAGDSRSIVGTEGYLPPEGPGSRQADLYSLGKLLYEACTGMNRGDYPRLPKNLADLPDSRELLEFNEVLLKACAKDTERRYHRAEELLADLALLERGDSVKRLRRLERHHAFFKRVGAAALVISLIGSGAWWQSWRAHRLANHHLAQLHALEGTQHLVQGDYAAALPWLVGALALDSGNSYRERAHRTRIAETLNRCPVPLGYFSSPGSRTLATDLHPEGTTLATAHEDGWVRLWDTRTGRQIQQLPHDFPVVLCQFLSSGDRMLTATLGQRVHLWNLAKPEVAPLTFPQAMETASDVYSVGLNTTLGRAYLSKSRYCFPRIHPSTDQFENLTLSLKLVGLGDALSVRYEIRRAAPDNSVLYHGEFRDSPAAELFHEGRDDPPLPLWGRVMVAIENGSVGERPGERSRVIWDNLRVRRYPSGASPASWRVVDDFNRGELTNWIHVAPAASLSACREENGHLILSSENLPLAQFGWSCVVWRELFDISTNHTLEVEADLISAIAPFPMVGLSLCRPCVSPYNAPNRPFIVQDRWLPLSWWDKTIRVWDLQKEQFVSARIGDQIVPVELQHPRPFRQGDLREDARYLTLAEPSDRTDLEDRYGVWDLATGRKVIPAIPARLQVTGTQFSLDDRYLAISHREGLELIRTSDWQSARTLGTGSVFDQPRFSPRGCRMAAVRDAREIVVWDLGDLAAPTLTFAHSADVDRIVFSPDGRYLASSSAIGMVHVWDVVRGEAFGPPLPGVLPRFSADGTQLVILGVEDGVWLWDLSRMAENPLLVPPLLAEQLSTSSADRSLTAQIDAQGIALITPAGQGSLPHPVRASLLRVTFSPDDRYLIAESSDLRAWVWDIRTRTLLGPPRPARYESSLTNHSRLVLPVENREHRTLSDLAALLGQQRPDGAGGMIPVNEAERGRLMIALKHSYPAEFTPDGRNHNRWHRDQALAAELAMNWDAAVFHWEHILKQEPEARNALVEIVSECHLAYARQAAGVLQQALLEGRSRWSVILPRPAQARPEMLDLSNFYTLALGESLVAGHPNPSFRPLAGGVQVLGGTGFDVRGIIHLKQTNHVTIPVGRACQRLHFLHAASQSPKGNRETVGSYQVRYASGKTAAVRLLNPEDLPPFTANRFHEVSPLSRTNISSALRRQMVWSGCNPGPARKQDVLYLTRATWELPASHRHEVVKSIELRAGAADSAPLVFAITVE